MRKTSQDTGDSTSISSGMDGDHRKSGPGIIKSTRDSIRKRVQSLSHESDDAVIEPLLQKDKPENVTSAKFMTKCKTDQKRKDSFKSASGSVFESISTIIEDGVKDNQFDKLSKTTIGSSGNNESSTVGLVNTQVLIDIEGQKTIGSNTSNPLIFTTAKIHANGKSKQMKPVLVTPVPILSTIENSNFKPGLGEQIDTLRESNNDYNTSKKHLTSMPPVTSVVSNFNIYTVGKSDSKNMISLMKSSQKSDLENKITSSIIKSPTPDSMELIKSSQMIDDPNKLQEVNCSDAYTINAAAITKAIICSALPSPSTTLMEHKTKHSEKTIMIDSTVINSKLECPHKTGKGNERLSEKELISGKNKDLNELSRLRNEVLNTDVNKNVETQPAISLKYPVPVIDKQPDLTSEESSSKDIAKITCLKRTDTNKLQRQKQNVDETNIQSTSLTNQSKNYKFNKDEKTKNEIKSKSASSPVDTNQPKETRDNDLNNHKTSLVTTVSTESSITIHNVISTPKTTSNNEGSITISSKKDLSAVDLTSKIIITTTTTSTTSFSSKPSSKYVTSSIPTVKKSTTATKTLITASQPSVTAKPTEKIASVKATPMTSNTVSMPKTDSKTTKITSCSVVKSAVGTSTPIVTAKTDGIYTSTFSNSSDMTEVPAHNTKPSLPVHKSTSNDDKNTKVNKDTNQTKA